MVLRSLLRTLKERGIRLEVSDGELLVKAAKGSMTKELLLEIKNQKQELISYLRSIDLKKTAAIPSAPIALSYPLSSSQLRLWVLSKMEGGNVAYNIPNSVSLQNAFDFEYFSRAIDAVIDRHEILRTVFIEDESGEIRQWVKQREAIDFHIQHLDYREQGQAAAQAFIARDAYQAFDLETGPLMRAYLIQLAEESYIFYYNMHHIVSDGWSIEVLANDVLHYYQAFSAGEQPTLKPLKIQYKDYAHWQLQQLNASAFQQHKAYWLNQLAGELPRIDLPATQKRPLIKTNSGCTLGAWLGESLSQNLQAYCKKQGGSLYMGLLASLKVLLYRYTGQEDLIIGSPVAGREHADLDNQIGFYINTLVFRNPVDGRDSFDEFFAKIRQSTLEAYRHQNYPFDQLVNELNLRRDTSRNAVFDIMLVLQDARQNTPAIDSNDEIIDYGQQLSKVDIEFSFQEIGQQIKLHVNFNTDVYDKALIIRLIQHYRCLLSSLLDQPQQPIQSVNYLTTDEQEELLHSLNQTQADFPDDQTLLDLFLKQVSKRPNAIALLFEEQSYSYQEVHELTNQLAHFIRQRCDCSPDDLIGIMIDRNEWMIFSILAVLKVGGAYVPIDPKYPQDRIQYMLEDSQCCLLIDEQLIEEFQAHRDQLPVDDLPITIQPSNLAYVIYTSGSTGRPKGVLVEHRGAVNRIEWMWQVFGFQEGEVVLQKTAFTFDVSVWEIFLPLCWGNTMVLISKMDSYIPERLLGIIERFGINSMHFVPSMLRAFLSGVQWDEEQRNKLKSLKRIIASGEALSADSVQQWYQLCSAPLHNLYGPTEASIDVSYYTTQAEDKDIPIGQPIWNTQLYVLDAQQQFVAKGIEGEICIGGIGLARGYLNRSDLTAEKFIDHPFIPTAKLYRTGDKGAWSQDDQLLYLGRYDDQVKIRGYRIEIREIEVVLLSKPSVQQAAVIVKEGREGREGDQELAAYLVSTTTENSRELRQYLRSFLPAYMIPAHFVQLEALPLTSSGKTDKKALLSRATSEVATGLEYTAPRNELEKQLAKIIAAELSKEEDNIGIEDNFFDLGGNSIKMTRITSKINRVFNTDLKTTLLFQFPNIKSLSENVFQQETASVQSTVEEDVDISNTLDEMIDFMNEY